MKPSITYREITVAIGILVAMGIAMTLWMGVPAVEVSGLDPHPLYDLPSSAKTFILNITSEFFAQKSSPLQGI